MKIALAIFEFWGRGGTQRQFLSLARALKRQNHDVTIYVPAVPENAESIPGLKIVTLDNLAPLRENLGYGPWGKVARKFRHKAFLTEVSRKIAELIDSDTDVLNVHDDESYKIGYFYHKRNSLCKIIWTMNDPPVSFRPKTLFFLDILRRVFVFFELIHERKFFKPIAGIVVLDDRNKKMAEKFYHRPAVIIRSGLDFDMFYFPVKKRDFHARPVKLLAVGILMAHRRFEDLILAADILRKKGRKFMLTIVSHGGSALGPYGEKIQSLVSSLFLGDAVDFRFSGEGGISDTDLVRIYHDSDIFVFPNHMQTWGLVAFEAMASGLPVIISKTTGVAEVLTDMNNALLVEPMRPDQIADKAEALMDSPELYAKIAAKGQQFVKENISWDTYAEKVLAFATNKTSRAYN